MNLITNRARVYVNGGRVIADCPMDCGSALVMEPGAPVYHCSECGHLCEVEWPDNLNEIMGALQRRPIPKTRNWFPSGHSLALRAGCPHGQTVKELEDETAEHTGA